MNEKENKMSFLPINKLMITMGIPMILSMMLQAVPICAAHRLALLKSSH